jgi:transcriptional regulator with XRE-family HTH domain
LARLVAERCRALRLHHNRSQAGLAAAAGVSLASLKRFESTGQIAFVSLVRLAYVLGCADAVGTWFATPPALSIDEVLGRKPGRRRGRRA